MKKSSFKYLLVIVLTFAVAAVIFKIHSAESIMNNKILSFPLSIGKWSGKEIVMDNWVFGYLETPYAILRDYSQGGKKVNLALVWYDDKNIAFHAPEACLGGVGNLVKEKRVEMVKTGATQTSKIGSMIAETRDGRSQLVFYYFITDGFMTPDQTELRKKVLFKRFGFKRTSAAFVRLMTPINTSKKDARLVLESFLRVIVPLIPEYTDTKKIQNVL